MDHQLTYIRDWLVPDFDYYCSSGKNERAFGDGIGRKWHPAATVAPVRIPAEASVMEMLALPSRGKLLDQDRSAYSVLALLLMITLLLWQLSARQNERRIHDGFLHLASKKGDVIRNRMAAYELVLRGAEALFAASIHVSRSEWRMYIEPLKLDSMFPGTQGVGFAEAILPGELQAHEKRIRAEGFPDYRVRTSGEQELLSSIVFLEPFNQSNRRAFGYDMYDEPVRRAAMARARDNDDVALSGKVTLLQESGVDIQNGFLMYLPVYRRGAMLEDVASRRRALQGFVYSPFRAKDLMVGISKTANLGLELELFDGEALVENRLYASTDSPREARYSSDIELQIGGRLWTARIRSSKSFESGIAGAQPLIILGAGLGLSFAVFSMLLINARHRRMMRIAAMELGQSRDNYKTLVENVPGTVFRSQTEEPWVSGHVSQDVYALTGESPQRFLSGEITLRQFIHPEDMSRVVNAVERAIAASESYVVEYRIIVHGKGIRWVSERGRASYNDMAQPQWLDGVMLDVTDRKLAELALRDLAYFDPLTGLPNRRVLTEHLSQRIAATGRSRRYDAVLFIDMDNFKAVNDRLGHAAGDLMLIEVARRLRKNVRENDTVTRLGGDEFVLVLDDLANDEGQATKIARQVGETLIEALNRPYRLGTKVQRSSPSVGIAIFSGHEATADELLRRADQAMYGAKTAGRNRLEVHEAERV